MATVKIVLRAVVNKDGTSPLALRITKDRKSSFIHLGHHVKKEDWDSKAQRVKKTHPNSVRLNNLLLKKLVEASDKTMEAEMIRNEVSSSTLKTKVKPKSSSHFFGQAEIYLKNLKQAGKYNQYTADKPRLGHFREFLKGSDIVFPDITVSLLETFKLYLSSRTTTAKDGRIKKMSDRTILNHLVTIRSVFSQAVKENIVDVKYYPFGKGKISIKFPQSNKVGLSPEDVKNLETVELIEPHYNHARNLWLISFYFAGMRVSDVLRLKWSDLKDGRLHYVMGKNYKAGSLKIPEKALGIFNQYKGQRTKNSDLVFPDLRDIVKPEDDFYVQRQIAFTTSRMDKFLRLHVAPKAGIVHKLTMHIARHTFGNISGDRIPVQMLQKLYRHSSITTTIGYQANFINKDADDALDAVIGS